MCKYGKSFYKLHNFSVELHRFFEYRLHIKLPYLIYVDKKWKRLSGTDKCPYNKSRNYTCWDCKYQAGIEECSIPYDDRKQNIPKYNIYYLPQHFLYFLPLPHGQGSFLPTFFSLRTVPAFFCSLYNAFFLSESKIVSHCGNS